jgi:hypothetical protein
MLPEELLDLTIGVGHAVAAGVDPPLG